MQNARQNPSFRLDSVHGMVFYENFQLIRNAKFNNLWRNRVFQLQNERKHLISWAHPKILYGSLYITRTQTVYNIYTCRYIGKYIINYLRVFYISRYLLIFLPHQKIIMTNKKIKASKYICAPRSVVHDVHDYWFIGIHTYLNYFLSFELLKISV